MKCLTMVFVTWAAVGTLAATVAAAEAEEGPSTDPVAERVTTKEADRFAANEDGEKQGFRKAPQAHLDEIQGRWARTEKTGFLSSQKLTKEINSDSETLTTYDSQGNVVSAHKVKVKLGLAGPIRVFFFTDQEFTKGPQAGRKVKGTQAYLYKIVGDTFIEIWGVLGDGDDEIRVMRWQRQ